MKKFLIFLILIIFWAGCGHRKSPTGGKKDVINPEIVAITPDEFSDLTGSDIEVVFSKPIERNTIYSGVYIYPPIQNKKFKWDKSTLTIRILENLEIDTNYFVTFSTKIKGEHGNELDREYTFIYASGKLSENRISGRIVFEDQEDSKLPVLCTLMSADSSYIFKRTISTPTFALENLNQAEHIIEAYCDKNKNNRYDYGKEPYCYLSIPADKFVSVNLEMAYSDTLKPALKSASAVWNNQIEIVFNESVVELRKISLHSADSLAEPLKIITKALKEDRLLILTEPMDTLNYEAKIFGLTDRKRNVADTLSIILKSSALVDTIPPKIVSVIPRSGGLVDEFQPIIRLGFSEIILSKDLSARLIEAETAKEIPLTIISDFADIFELMPEQKLTNYSTYHISVEASDLNGNKLSRSNVASFIAIIR